MKYAIQCIDAKTGKHGSFGYEEEALKVSKRFVAITPVFPDLVKLYDYARENGITLAHK